MYNKIKVPVTNMLIDLKYKILYLLSRIKSIRTRYVIGKDNATGRYLLYYGKDKRVGLIQLDKLNELKSFKESNPIVVIDDIVYLSNTIDYSPLHYKWFDAEYLKCHILADYVCEENKRYFKRLLKTLK